MKKINGSVMTLIIYILAISILLVYYIHPVYASEVPRNLITYGENQTNNSITNQTIPENFVYLLQRLEELRKIVAKYNTTLASQISDIEMDLMMGKIGKAEYKYIKLQDELKTLSNLLSNLNPEDYKRLIDILNENLWKYMSPGSNPKDISQVLNSNIDLRNISDISSGLNNIGMNRSIANPSSLNINIPKIYTPSLPELNTNDIYLLGGSSLILLLITVLISSKKVRNNFWEAIITLSNKISGMNTQAYKSSHPIINTYYKFLDKSHEKGFGKEPHEGPIEHANRITDNTLKKIGIDIANLFEKIKYGKKELSKDEYIEAQRISNAIEKLGEENIDK